jgi:hypothetical protein
MTCPSCKLENPPSAVRCDCGYVFAASVSPRERSLQSLPVDDPPLVVYLRSIDDSLRTIKRILVWWVTLSAIAAILAFISFFFSSALGK